jgi:hypothetical protein
MSKNTDEMKGAYYMMPVAAALALARKYGLRVSDRGANVTVFNGQTQAVLTPRSKFAPSALVKMLLAHERSERATTAASTQRHDERAGEVAAGGEPDPDHQWLTVTPAMAEAFLAKNRNFRHLNDDHVIRLAVMMERGEWDANGQTLKFDRDGYMVDGQHRCHACVLSGRPFRTLVVRNVASDANVDTTARARTLVDVARHVGVSSAQHTAPVVAWWYAIEAGARTHKQVLQLMRALSPELFAERLRRDRGDIEHAMRVAPPRSVMSQTPAVILWLWVIRGLGGAREPVEQFLLDVGTGAELKAGDSALALRTWLFSRGTSRRKPHITLAALVQAWNARVRGTKRMSVESFNSPMTVDSEIPEPLPGLKAAAPSEAKARGN